MKAWIVAMVVGAMAIGGCKSEKEKAIEQLAENIEKVRAEQEQAQKEEARAKAMADRIYAEEKKKLEDAIKVEDDKIDAIAKRLAVAKDATERASIQKELDEARKARMRMLGGK